MIYRPQPPSVLWDSWLFPWQDRFHLFHLDISGKEGCGQVGHAVSSDLLHWEPRPAIHTRGRPSTWNDTPTFTGMTLRHDGRFYMPLGSNPGGVEMVGLYTSEDLDHWTEHPASPVLKPQAPYRTTPCPALGNQEVDFRDPCVLYDRADGFFHAFLCARVGEPGPNDTGAAVAHYRSPDLIRWEPLPPVATVGHRFFHTEVPDLFELNGTWYLIFHTLSFGLRVDTPSKEAPCGSFYLIGGESYQGPYRVPDDPLIVGSGGFAGYRMDGVSARTIAYEGGRLLYHHIASKPPAWAAPKRVRQRADKSLFLEYLPLLAGLETRTVLEGPQAVSIEDGVKNFGQWRCDGDALIGSAGAGASALTVARGVPDLHLLVDVVGGSAERAGVCFKVSDKEMALLFLDYLRNELYVGAGRLNAPWGLELFPAQDRFRTPLHRDRAHRLRVFVREQHVEAYLDERWVFTYVLGGDSQADGAALLVHRGEARFSNLRIAAIEPLR